MLTINKLQSTNRCLLIQYAHLHPLDAPHISFTLSVELRICRSPEIARSKKLNEILLIIPGIRKYNLIDYVLSGKQHFVENHFVQY